MNRKKIDKKGIIEKIKIIFHMLYFIYPQIIHILCIICMKNRNMKNYCG